MDITEIVAAGVIAGLAYLAAIAVFDPRKAKIPFFILFAVLFIVLRYLLLDLAYPWFTRAG